MGGNPPGAPGIPGLGKASPGGSPWGKPGGGPECKAAWGGGGPMLEVVVVAPQALVMADEAAGEVEVGDTGE